jgi:putative ABC transport system substrate-binding protein
MARAQQERSFTVGWLSIISPATPLYLPDFKKGLADLGYVEGQNLTIEYRWAEGHVEKLPAPAADLVAKNVNVIASGSNLPTALAAKAATSSIPITFFIAEDPVRAGLVNSLNRPGGNVTGITALSLELTMKHVELMHELLRDAAFVAVLVNSRNNGEEFGRAAQEAAARFGQQVVMLKATTPADFDAALDTMPKGTGGLIITSDPLFATNHEKLAGLAEWLKVPTIFGDGNSEDGGLISYGPRLPQMFRDLGQYTAKILAGASPADLPVQQPANLPLKINLRTAQVIGVEILPTFLARADEVIE